MNTAPRLWPESTIVCLASGPSLTQADVDFCRGKARVIAIKDTIRLAPWADVLYACDAKWWRHHAKTLTFTGPRYALESAASTWATVLQQTGDYGLETAPTGLRTGRNSGYQAINLAVHLGAKLIALLGYDMQMKGPREYFFAGDHPYPHRRSPFADFLRLFDTIVAPLQALGVRVVNCTRTTALKAFPCQTLEGVLGG